MNKGQQHSNHRTGGGGQRSRSNSKERKDKDKKERKDRSEKNRMPTFGKHKKKHRKGPEVSTKLPSVVPNNKCKLRLLKLHQISDWLLLEEEFVKRSQINAIHKIKDPKKKEEEEETEALFNKLRSTPMRVCTLEEVIDDEKVIISTEHGSQYYVPIMSFVDKEQLEPNCKVLSNYTLTAVVGYIDIVDPKVEAMRVDRAPVETYADIGGLDQQIQELKEAVELPLTNPQLYEEMGVKPPKGVILYGPPGTGKTLLAKAVANQTSATFLHVVGSELIQKYLGDGPKLVRDLFKTAEEYAPTIIFIDEIDAIGTKRSGIPTKGL